MFFQGIHGNALNASAHALFVLLLVLLVLALAGPLSSFRKPSLYGFGKAIEVIHDGVRGSYIRRMEALNLGACCVIVIPAEAHGCIGCGHGRAQGHGRACGFSWCPYHGGRIGCVTVQRHGFSTRYPQDSLGHLEFFKWSLGILSV